MLNWVLNGLGVGETELKDEAGDVLNDNNGLGVVDMALNFVAGGRLGFLLRLGIVGRGGGGNRSRMLCGILGWGGGPRLKLGRGLLDGLGRLAGGGSLSNNSFGILGCGGGPRLKGSKVPRDGGGRVGRGGRADVGAGMLKGSGVVTTV